MSVSFYLSGDVDLDSDDYDAVGEVDLVVNFSNGNAIRLLKALGFHREVSYEVDGHGVVEEVRLEDVPCGELHAAGLVGAIHRYLDGRVADHEHGEAILEPGDHRRLVALDELAREAMARGEHVVFA